jgi:putative transposase
MLGLVNKEVVMPRLPRFIIPGQPQHIIVRGNNRTEIFCIEQDYLFYLEKLKAACEKHGCDLHAYVLMTNHVHLLVTPHEENSLSKAMQMIGRHYVQYFNYCYRRTGTLWEGRYKASLIDSENYLFCCMRYIELNPVRAGMVFHPSDYPWSSYRFNALGDHNDLLIMHEEYRRLGQTDDARQSAYRSLFAGHMDDVTINTIREATNKAWVLGSDRFKQRIAAQIDRRVEPLIRGGDRKSLAFRVRN